VKGSHEVKPSKAVIEAGTLASTLLTFCTANHISLYGYPEDGKPLKLLLAMQDSISNNSKPKPASTVNPAPLVTPDPKKG
jgi:hypothetical protein